MATLVPDPAVRSSIPSASLTRPRLLPGDAIFSLIRHYELGRSAGIFCPLTESPWFQARQAGTCLCIARVQFEVSLRRCKLRGGTQQLSGAFGELGADGPRTMFNLAG